MADYQEQVEELIKMLSSKDADGIDRYLYRYEDKGLGMLAIALYHGLLREVKEGNAK